MQNLLTNKTITLEFNKDLTEEIMIFEKAVEIRDKYITTVKAILNSDISVEDKQNHLAELFGKMSVKEETYLSIAESMVDLGYDCGFPFGYYVVTNGTDDKMVRIWEEMWDTDLYKQLKLGYGSFLLELETLVCDFDSDIYDEWWNHRPADLMDISQDISKAKILVYTPDYEQIEKELLYV